jgi:hypothetical protein
LPGVFDASLDDRLAPVTDHDGRLSRRALLGAAVIVVAGCTTTRHPAAPDPDAATVAAARDSELQLLASYVTGTPEHTAHLAHLRALGGDLPSSPATPGTATQATADEAASVPVLQAAARGAHNGTTAAVLASIAASHAVLGRQKR